MSALPHFFMFIAGERHKSFWCHLHRNVLLVFVMEKSICCCCYCCCSVSLISASKYELIKMNDQTNCETVLRQLNMPVGASMFAERHIFDFLLLLWFCTTSNERMCPKRCIGMVIKSHHRIDIKIKREERKIQFKRRNKLGRCINIRQLISWAFFSLPPALPLSLFRSRSLSSALCSTMSGIVCTCGLNKIWKFRQQCSAALRTFKFRQRIYAAVCVCSSQTRISIDWRMVSFVPCNETAQKYKLIISFYKFFFSFSHFKWKSIPS